MENSKKIDPKIKFQILKEVWKIAATKLEEKISAHDLAKALDDLNNINNIDPDIKVQILNEVLATAENLFEKKAKNRDEIAIKNIKEKL